MSALRTWFDGRSLREKRLILVMLGLTALTLVWAGIVRPVRDGLSSARERHADAVVRLATTESAVDAIRGAGRRVPLTGSLADALRAQAESAGFVLASLDERGGGRVHATIQAARPAALSRWVAGLEGGGILVDSATWHDNGDGSVAADLVVRARAS
ncbi:MULTISPECIES: type II secretion system protein GspM [unclassified Sphingomonas]|jgi:general secretion pathway protein M|uniref:type II secretion system protein GspM n=1 Tax=unclassified Sphingomonas TaxID=196159 RepID=UPI000E10A7D1|nr:MULTISPECIES: type II secretion system protein GspM [unclassified Sphingomonas]AXJ94299.1 type II secretion system protein M [Sphingomonas sp. FARSPH]